MISAVCKGIEPTVLILARQKDRGGHGFDPDCSLGFLYG